MAKSIKVENLRWTDNVDIGYLIQLQAPNLNPSLYGQNLDGENLYKKNLYGQTLYGQHL